MRICRKDTVNWVGQLGDGTTEDRHTPVQVENLSNVIAITTGFNHTVALKSDGTVWAWGENQNGQLGDGTTSNMRSTPQKTQGPLADCVAIAAGSQHTLALKCDGTVWAWGSNNNVVLGFGETVSDLHVQLEPAIITGLSNIISIASNQNHSVALDSNGALWAWGANYYGQLGNGDTDRQSTPVQVIDPLDASGFLNFELSHSAIPTFTTEVDCRSAGGYWHDGQCQLIPFCQSEDTDCYSQSDLDTEYEAGKQYCIDNPELCGIEISGASRPPFVGTLPENIQSYLVLTDSTPFYLSPGNYVQTFGSEGNNTINIEKYSRVQCKNFVGENEVNIEEASSEFTVYRSGTTVYLNSTSGTRLEIAATETPQTLRFADGSLVLKIVAGNVMLGNQLVDGTERTVESVTDDSDTSENIF